MITELLPQRLLGPGLVEKGARHPGATQPLLRLQDSDVGRGRRGVGRRRLNVMHRALRHHTAIGAHHQHLGRALGGWPRWTPRSAPPGG
jgi:hypothetical protein